jgi:hypothetical protein
MAHTETHTTKAHAGRLTEMETCIQDCEQCARACLELVTHCLEQGGEHAARDHIRLLLDCANACETSAKFMIRGSELHKIYCQACADVCVRCAEDCARFQDDETMMRCAEICRKCADSCEKMAS